MASSELNSTVTEASSDRQANRFEWYRAQWFLAGYLVFLLFFYSSSFLSMVSIWQRSDTFAHGFIIPLISLWLIYRAAPRLKMEPLSFSYLGATAVLMGAAVWLVGNLAQVLVVEQLSVVVLLVSGVVAIIGLRQSRVIVFPLAFLFLMVPMGEELIEPMMEFTATSTVWLIRLVDIPVYREGLYFSLPSGNWSVVEACSGVRYLIASFALGLLYAYLTYRTLYKRLLFVGLSIIIPVFANSLRAFMIVMIGHYSDMQYAVGVDHLIYGWAFFGVVIFLMFWLGSFFADDELNYESSLANKTLNNDKRGECSHGRSRGYPSGYSKVLFGVMLLVLVGVQSIPERLMADSSIAHQFSVDAPYLEGLDVQFVAAPWSWHPGTPNAQASGTQYYQFDGNTYGLYFFHFLKHQPGSELVNSLDQWISEHDVSWRVVESTTEKIVLEHQTVSAERVLLSDGLSTVRVWRWYSIGNSHIANRYLAKFYEFLNLFDSSENYSSRYYMATKVDKSPLDGNYKEFLQKLIPQLSSTSSTGIAVGSSASEKRYQEGE
tara:strand:- start:34189 stop:35829 length:1641 start_codon:yes stop_codon:yes gene_type:complete